MVQQESGRLKMVFLWLLCLATRYGVFDLRTWGKICMQYLYCLIQIFPFVSLGWKDWIMSIFHGWNQTIFILLCSKRYMIILFLVYFIVLICIFSKSLWPAKHGLYYRYFYLWAGDTSVTAVYEISTWNKIGHKRLIRKSASVMSISHDGKYLSL